MKSSSYSSVRETIGVEYHRKLYLEVAIYIYLISNKMFLSIPEKPLVSSHTKYQVTRRLNASILIKAHRGC